VVKRGDGGYTPPPPSLPAAGLGRLRKIAIIGSAESSDHAPHYDPTWEIWTHAVTIGRCKRIDRVFELHPEHVWREHVKPQWPSYLKWLQRCPYPIYMLEKHADIPTSVRYPLERLFGEYRGVLGGRLVFTSQTDFMIALALSEGVTHLGFFGVQYTAPIKDGERNEQLLGLHYWAGVASGKGVSIVLPEGHPSFVHQIYGLETHATKAQYAARLEAERAVTGKNGQRETLVPSVGPLKPPPARVTSESQDEARARWDQLAEAGA
jgi:hypothetical protein